MQAYGGTNEEEGHLDALISTARLRRYLLATDGDIRRARALYAHNLDLSEAFLPELYYLEVGLRNRLADALSSSYGPDWASNPFLLKLFDDRQAAACQCVARDQRRKRGDSFLPDHVVVSLSFGFWNSLLKPKQVSVLWADGLAQVLPEAKGLDAQTCFASLNAVRLWRNRIAHHRAIFHRGPMQNHQRIIASIGWISPPAARAIAAASRVPQVISRRPR